RLLAVWIASIGLDPKVFGTHSLRRTQATLIYRRQVTCELCSSCSDIPRSKAQSDTSASKSIMPWRWRNKLMSEIPGQSRHALPDLYPPFWADTRHRPLVRNERGRQLRWPNSLSFFTMRIATI